MWQNIADSILLGALVYHIAVGIPCFFPPKLILAIGRRLYSMNIPLPLDARYEYTLKPLGAYAVFVAGVCTLGLLVLGPEERRWLYFLLAYLFCIRAVFRVFYADLFHKAFSVPYSRSRYNIWFNAALVALLIVGGFA